MERVNVLYVEDDEDWRQGLQRYFADADGFHLLACVATMDHCFEILQRETVDIVIMDIILDEHSRAGLDGTLELLVRFPDTKVIMLSSLDRDDDIFNEAFLNGAYDYVYKHEFEQLPDVIRAAMRSPSKYGERLRKLVFEQKKKLLTDGDRRLLELLLQGGSQTQIAQELNVTLAAVKKQVGRVKKKFGWERSSTELADRCKKWGLLDETES